MIWCKNIKIIIFIFFTPVALYGMGMGITPQQRSIFFYSIENCPKIASDMMKTSGVYAFLIRPFSTETALEFAIVCYKKNQQESGYLPLIESLIEQNITWSDVNPLKACSPYEIEEIIEIFLGEKNKNMAIDLKNFVKRHTPIDIVQETKIQVSDDEFFAAFGTGSQKKLLTFFDKFPAWFDKIHESKNSTLHLALKNFSDIKEDFILIEKLVQYNSKNIVLKNLENEDALVIINTFESSMRKKLYDCLRSSLKSCWVQRSLREKFSQVMKLSDYATMVTMLGANPELVHEIDSNSSKTILYCINNPEKNLTKEQEFVLQRLKRFTELFAPGLEEINGYHSLRKKRIKGTEKLVLKEDEEEFNDLKRRFDGGNKIEAFFNTIFGKKK